MRAKTISLVLISVLASSLLGWSSPAAACAEEDVRIQDYDVTFSVGKKVYDIGDTARFKVWVTNKVTQEPVEDVDVGLGLYQRDDFLFGFSRTDDKGLARAKIVLKKRSVSPGWVDLYAAAWKKQADTVCVSASGGGDTSEDRAFRIRKR